MNFYTRSLGALGAAVLLAGAADAALISQTVTWSLQPTELSNAAPTPSSLNYFDTTLGVLDSVTISSTYGFNSTFALSNTSAGSVNGYVQTETAAQFKTNDSAINAILNQYVNTGPGVTYDGTTVLTPTAYDLTGSKQFYTLATGASDNSKVNSGSGTTNTGALTSTSALLAFELAGGGSFDPVANTLSSLLFSQNGGNLTASQTTNAQGSLTVVYNYHTLDAVPEPASWAMMVGGFGLLGAALRRKRNVAVSFG